LENQRKMSMALNELHDFKRKLPGKDTPDERIYDKAPADPRQGEIPTLETSPEASDLTQRYKEASHGIKPST
jgi:hypothetical protein